MPDSRIARERLIRGLVLVATLTWCPQVACNWGAKYAREGEACASSDKDYVVEAACAGGLTCLAIRFDGRGNHEGLCTAACDSRTTCGAGVVCAAGACVRPCSAECAPRFDSSGVCCRLPLEGVSACLPAATCDRLKGSRDGGSGDLASTDGGAGQ